MRKKTIGEVLRLARINQGMSLEDLQKKKTDLRYIEMQVMERKDFYLSSLLTLDKNVFMVRGSCLIPK